MKIYLDGKWVSKDKAKVSVFDHGFLYGDGVFEGIRSYNGTPFRLKEHLERLYRSAHLISLKIPYSIPQMIRVVLLTLKRNFLTDAYIRLLVTRGVGDLGLDPRVCKNPSVIVIVDKLALFASHYYKEGLHVIVAKTRRNLFQALDPTIKSMNYLNNILAKVEANNQGVPEAIMLNKEGYVSECTGDNVFYIKGKTIVTPPVKAGVLKGITRGVVISLVRSCTPYRMKEKLFRRSEIFAADELFFTGTAAEIIPVTRVNGRLIGRGKPGPVTQELIDIFKELIRKETWKG